MGIDRPGYIRSIFTGDGALRTLGSKLAEHLYETASRPGFFRTMEWMRTRMWVPEFTKDEYKLCRRWRRRGISKEGIRQGIYWIRNNR